MFSHGSQQAGFLALVQEGQDRSWSCREDEGAVFKNRANPGCVEAKLCRDVRAPGAVRDGTEDSQSLRGFLDSFQDVVSEGETAVDMDSQVSRG